MLVHQFTNYALLWFFSSPSLKTRSDWGKEFTSVSFHIFYVCISTTWNECWLCVLWRVRLQGPCSASWECPPSHLDFESLPPDAGLTLLSCYSPKAAKFSALSAGARPPWLLWDVEEHRRQGWELAVFMTPSLVLSNSVSLRENI